MYPVIYGLHDPRVIPIQVRYGGCARRSTARRLQHHIQRARNGKLTYLSKWIRKLLHEGVKPTLVMLADTTEQDWQKDERRWIRKLKKKFKLTNSTEGGDGLVDPSPDVRRRISKKVSKSLIGNKRRLGIPHSEEARKAIRRGMRSSPKFRAAMLAKRGRLLSRTHRRAISLSTRGVPKSPAHRRSIGKAMMGNQNTLGYRHS